MKNSNKNKDTRLKNFWRKNDRFADLFNAVLFGGREVLKAEHLEEMDTDVSGIVKRAGYEETLVRSRDVIKKMAYGVEFAVLGIENQQHIHYAMPLRVLLYDGLGYLKECRELAGRQKNAGGKHTDAEFLSGMSRQDRLHPIITIVVYYGEAPWDGPLSLRDMLVEMPESLWKYVPDYKMNLVQVRESGQYVFQNEDVKTVFEISRELFAGNLDKIAREYGKRDLKAELVSVIGAITESSFLLRQSKREEELNMCSSLEKLRMDGVHEGISQGISQGIVQGIRQRNAEIILKLLKKDYSVQEIADLLEIPADEVTGVRDGAAAPEQTLADIRPV